ncbi:MAG: sulfurtransferase [Planctomycetales bacterium]|nr:sulfurtransferase [Planctomycetales bacterium]
MNRPMLPSLLFCTVVVCGLLMPGRLRAESNQYLIQAPALHAQLGQAASPPDVLDVRTRDAYDEGHIPQAKWVDANAWRSKTFAEAGLLDRDYWASELGRLGLTHSHPVVVVGDSLPDSSRVWWLLRYLGWQQVRLLDGGQKAWTDAELPLSSETPRIEPTQPTVEFVSERLGILADIGGAAQQGGQCAILDTRSDSEFTGSRGVGTRTGHIPGAHHVEWKRFVDSQGKFLAPQAIRELLQSDGVDLQQPIVTHCQSGGRSSVAVLALEMAGVKSVKNYYRGWSEYGEALELPVEKKTAQEQTAE